VEDPLEGIAFWEKMFSEHFSEIMFLYEKDFVFLQS